MNIAVGGFPRLLEQTAGQLGVGRAGISWIASERFPGKISGVAKQPLDPPTRRGDGYLWVIAFGLSLLANAGILAAVGFAALESAILRAKSPPPPAPPAQTVVMIFPEVGESVKAPAVQAGTLAAAPPVVFAGSRFARTSDDQTAARPDSPAFLGERNTRATSDRPPDPSAPPLPSQAGVMPQDAGHLETTESDYRDGPLDSGHAAAPVNEMPPEPAEPALAEPSPAMADPEPADLTEPAAPAAAPSPRQPLLDGPLPVEVPVPREDVRNHARQLPPAARLATEDAPATPPAPPKTAEDPRPKAPVRPGFKGFQRKTAVVGSISRTGRSALDVEDSPLGRYQAALSRAVELEWQRNCVRHRDFITPGFLTVRFFVEPGGKVRSVQFVGDMATGEVQKGFTLNSIRDAAIPAMPPVLRRQYDQEPLELIFRFYF